MLHGFKNATKDAKRLKQTKVTLKVNAVLRHTILRASRIARYIYRPDDPPRFPVKHKHSAKRKTENSYIISYHASWSEGHLEITTYA